MKIFLRCCSLCCCVYYKRLLCGRNFRIKSRSYDTMSSKIVLPTKGRPHIMVLPDSRTLNFLLDRDASPSVTLTFNNNTSSAVAFKVKTTDKARYLVKPQQSLLEKGKSAKVKVTLRSSSCYDLLKDAFNKNIKEKTKDKFLLQTLQLDSDFYTTLQKDKNTLHATLQEAWEELQGDRNNFQYKKFSAVFKYPSPIPDPDKGDNNKLGRLDEEEEENSASNQPNGIDISISGSSTVYSNTITNVNHDSPNNVIDDIPVEKRIDRISELQDFTTKPTPNSDEIKKKPSPSRMFDELVALRKKYEDAAMNSIAQEGRIRDLQMQLHMYKENSAQEKMRNGAKEEENINGYYDNSINTNGAYMRRNRQSSKLLRKGNPEANQEYENSFKISFGFVHVIIVAVSCFLLGRLFS